MRERHSIPCWAWMLVLLVVGLDQWSKLWVMKALPVAAAKPIFSYLSLYLTFNTGAAFSFLAHSGGWQRYFFVLIALGMSAWLIRELKQTSSLLARWGLLLVLGGALGNLVDRIRLGHVVDFILVHTATWSFSVFNLADSAITAGVTCLLWTIWQDSLKELPREKITKDGVK
jgi:signal peptidase II